MTGGIAEPRDHLPRMSPADAMQSVRRWEASACGSL